MTLISVLREIGAMFSPSKIPVQVRSATLEADEIVSFDLRPLPPTLELPAFTAGSHIDVHLPNGLVRSYSIVNSEAERNRYVICVNRDSASRGGSQFMHEVLRLGDTLTVSTPRNNFPVDIAAPKSAFIAGGIGITPFLSMIERLRLVGRHWRLYYAARTRGRAAFTERLQKMRDELCSELCFSFDDENEGCLLNIREIVASLQDGEHIYGCGPTSLLKAFEEATISLPKERVHVEYFARPQETVSDFGFVVELARTKRTVSVEPGQSILDSLMCAGIETSWSCREGICGTCEVAVIEGLPDHRDFVLTKAERAEGKRMMICCSRAFTDKLVLDL